MIKHNPDVLDCLANLSSDEVFTPIKVAEKMIDLLPQKLFSNPKTTFLDPACKTGVFLREIVKRLDKGLETIIPDRQERINHILTKQIFGLPITHLTGLLSRRSVYCSKEANGEFSVCSDFKDEIGNIIFHELKHDFHNGSCKVCGASQSQYDRDDNLEQYAYSFIHTEINKTIFKKMKFDVIISNPPYQLNDGGAGASAKPIYHLFVQAAKKLNPRYIVMIIPSRWFSGGKGLDKFRKEMIEDTRMAKLVDYYNAKELFPAVEIKGGVCYFLWNKQHKKECEIETHITNDDKPEKSTRFLKYKDANIFIRNAISLSILEKVASLKETTFNTIVSTRKPFGLPTNFTDFEDTKFSKSIKIYANQQQGYVNRNIIEVHKDWINKIKVLAPKVWGIGNATSDWIKPFIAEKDSVCTETYLVIGPMENMTMAKNLISYTQTKFFHLLVSIAKITQDAPQGVYQFVPLQDFSKSWTDEELYKKYKLTEDEISFIENLIKPAN